jgi:hypothetical protein
MTEFGFPQFRPSVVRSDNMGTVRKSASDASDKRSLYMKRRVKFIQEAQRDEEVFVEHVPSELNKADILTKPLSTRPFSRIRDMILNIRRSAVNVHAIVWSRII